VTGMHQAGYSPHGRGSCKTASAGNGSRGRSPSQSLTGGFTLIEVLIAVVVLSVGIVLILQALHGALSAWDGGVERMRSAMLVQEKLEEWRLAARLTGEIPASDRGGFETPFADYRWQVESETVALPGAAPQAGMLHELLCTVWREGRDRTFAAATRVYLPPEPEAEEAKP